MKKNIIILTSLILITGCTRINQNTTNYNEIISKVLEANNSHINEVSIGYEYYLPRGAILLENNDYNQIFKINEEKIYLYVDILSYYYQKKLKPIASLNDSSYYQTIQDNGYIQIDDFDNQYYLKIVYNYAKIETYVKKENINKIITYSMIILNSIDYNEALIEGLINNHSASTQKINYELAGPNNNNDFSSLIEEYIVEEEETLPEE